MRLRWIFHRNMLSQSLSFYQDEFAGRVATKVMQTALAVRDSWMIVSDILVYLVIYFVTIGLVVVVRALLRNSAVSPPASLIELATEMQAPHTRGASPPSLLSMTIS